MPLSFRVAIAVRVMQGATVAITDPLDRLDGCGHSKKTCRAYRDPPRVRIGLLASDDGCFHDIIGLETLDTLCPFAFCAWEPEAIHQAALSSAMSLRLDEQGHNVLQLIASPACPTISQGKPGDKVLKMYTILFITEQINRIFGTHTCFYFMTRNNSSASFPTHVAWRKISKWLCTCFRPKAENRCTTTLKNRSIPERCSALPE